ncbi:MAG: pyridoxamine 5'-phosphate oxidase family protein [Adlercreutzia equolifaciens]
MPLRRASDNRRCGLPYSIPVSAAVAGGAIYFHSAKHGTKSKLLRAHPAVCLVGVRDVVPLPEAYPPNTPAPSCAEPSPKRP